MPRSIQRLRWQLAVIAGVLLMLAGSAAAQSVDKQLRKGVAFYNDLEYAKAIKVLEKALQKPENGSADKVREGFETLALSYLAKNNSAKVKSTFLRLLEFDDTYELPATVSEEAADIFEEAQQEIEARSKPDPIKLSLEHTVTPTVPTPGAAIDFTISMSAEAPVETLSLLHRTRGAKSFSSVRASKISGTSYTLTLSGSFVEAPGVEYYIVAKDKEGVVLASAGSAAAPLTLLTEIVDKPGGSPFYKKWWFWTAVGGTVATAVVLGLVLTGDSEPGASVTISVNPPPGP